MSEHSHGPWRAAFFGGKWCVLHKGGDDTTILAECGTHADARIMAAAIEMLTALKAIYTNEQSGVLPTQIHHMVIDAIAKATP